MNCPSPYFRLDFLQLSREFFIEHFSEAEDFRRILRQKSVPEVTNSKFRRIVRIQDWRRTDFVDREFGVTIILQS